MSPVIVADTVEGEVRNSWFEYAKGGHFRAFGAGLKRRSPAPIARSISLGEGVADSNPVSLTLRWLIRRFSLPRSAAVEV